jgi:drug/metabolite transporter (DMT)-like permease
MLSGSFFYSLQYLDVKVLLSNPSPDSTDSLDLPDYHYDYWTLLFFRGMVGFLICWIVLGINQERPMIGRRPFRLCLRGILGAFSVLCSFITLHYLSLSVANVFFATTPIWSALYSCAYSDNTLWTRKNCLSTLCCILGVVILASPQLFHLFSPSASETMKHQTVEFLLGMSFALFSTFLQSAVNVSIVYMSDEKSLVTSFYSMGFTMVLGSYAFFNRQSYPFHHFIYYYFFDENKNKNNDDTFQIDWLETFELVMAGILTLTAQTCKTIALQTSKSFGVTVLRFVEIPLAVFWDIVLLHGTWNYYELACILLLSLGIALHFFL